MANTAERINAVAKRTERFAILNVVICTYILLAVAGTRDADFYTLNGSISLPLIGVNVHPTLFYLVSPILCISTFIYFHLHLSLLNNHLLLWGSNQDSNADLMPWILLVLHDSKSSMGVIWNAVARFILFLIFWCLVPITCTVCWLRILKFRSTFFEWQENMGQVTASNTGLAVPPIDIIGILVAVSITCSLAILGHQCFIRVFSKSHGCMTHVIRATKMLLSFLLIGAFILITMHIVDLSMLLVSQAINLTPENNQQRGPLNRKIKNGIRVRAHHDPDILSKLILPFARVNLSDADLTYVRKYSGVVQGLIAEKSYLPFAELSGAYLENSILSKSILNDANMKGAIFTGANLSSSSMFRVNASAAIFIQADLSSTKLFDVDSFGAKYMGANLDRAILDYSDLRKSNFTGASLKNASMRHVVANGCIFNGADLRGVDFEGADLSNAKFVGAVLSGASFNGAKIAHSHFEVSSLVSASFVGADLSGALFEGAFIARTSFMGSKMPGARFDYSYFQNVIFDGAILATVRIERPVGMDVGGTLTIGSRVLGYRQLADGTTAFVNDARFDDAYGSNVSYQGATVSGPFYRLKEYGQREEDTLVDRINGLLSEREYISSSSVRIIEEEIKALKNDSKKPRNGLCDEGMGIDECGMLDPKVTCWPFVDRTENDCRQLRARALQERLDEEAKRHLFRRKYGHSEIKKNLLDWHGLQLDN